MISLRPVFASIGLAMFVTLAAACASPGAAQPDARAQPVVTAPPATKLEPTTAERATSPVPTLAPLAPAPAAPALLGRDHRSAVACSGDADCGWDDACTPTRCVEHRAPTACDESTPPPGTCTCVAGTCTLKPQSAPPPVGTCEPRACVVDRAGGRCVADDGGVAEGARFTRPVDVGPSCDCIRPDEGCRFEWFEPVPCTSDRDCWISPDPRRHPIARPKHLRRRDFRPCEDGEAAPLCGPAGRCVVGPGYSC